MIPVLISTALLGSVAALLVLGAGLPEPRTEAVVALENEAGEFVHYTLAEAREAIDQFKARRTKLVDYLAARDGTTRTPAQEARWARSYREAVALTAAIDSLERALP